MVVLPKSSVFYGGNMKYLILLVVLLSGCAQHTHDVEPHWQHAPQDIDGLVQHMDDKINALRLLHPEDMPCPENWDGQCEE